MAEREGKVAEVTVQYYFNLHNHLGRAVERNSMNTVHTTFRVPLKAVPPNRGFDVRSEDKLKMSLSSLSGRNDGTTRQDCLVAKILFELSSLFCLRYFKKMYNIAVVDKQLI